MLHRTFKLCSNFELFHQEIENLQTIYGKSNYPIDFTDIKKYLDNFCAKWVYLLAPKKQLTRVLPFFGKKSLQLRPRLVSSVNKTVRFCNLKVAFWSQRKLNTLFQFKDAVNKKTLKICSFLVFRYMCSNCNVTYYGKTYSHYFTTAAEHMGVSNLTWKRLKNTKDSAVLDHLLQCNCSVDFHHFDILANGISKFNLLVMESLLIKYDDPVLNRTTKSFPLELFD